MTSALMIENIIFCFAFALQIFAWVLAGGKFAFRPRSVKNTGKKACWNTVLFRRVCLCLGAAAVAGYAYGSHDYLLFAGQAVLLPILWFRVGIERTE